MTTETDSATGKQNRTPSPTRLEHRLFIRESFAQVATLPGKVECDPPHLHQVVVHKLLAATATWNYRPTSGCFFF